jgi:predicted  nucleic acid-binding Zn-ribbon protein
MKKHSQRGEIATIMLIVGACAGLVVGVMGSGWKPFQWLKPKPPTEQLSKLQAELDAAKAQAEAARVAKEAGEAAERAKQTEQIRYSQMMNIGAEDALTRVADKTAEVQLASDLVRRANFGLALAIGRLPVQQQAEIVRIVEGALSSVQAERDAAKAALAAKDVDLRAITAERDAIQRELPKLAAKAKELEAKVQAKDSEVVAKVEQLKGWAKIKDAAERQAGGLSAQIDHLWRMIVWIVAIWAFLAYVLPGLIKHLNAGPLKNALRDASGYATSPLLYADAKKKLNSAANEPTP